MVLIVAAVRAQDMTSEPPMDLPMGNWVREKVGLVLEELARIADIAKDPGRRRVLGTSETCGSRCCPRLATD
jgi:hypothetical protein